MVASFPLAFLAGILTAVSPCVIPVLPIILGSTLKRNRLYPFLMVLGMALSFSLLGMVFGSFGSFIGVGKRTLETVAILLIFLMGLVIVIRPLSTLFSRWMGQLLSFNMPVSRPSESLFQAFAVGGTLGVIWAPCAGPILASILVLAAASKNVMTSFLLLFTYAVGASIPMLLIAYGGQKALSGRRFIQQHAETIRYVFGWILIVAAILLYFGVFQRFLALVVPYFPDFITTL
ncbi:cytochrome c biogenesis protein CcdA [Candidatus Peregrinibacteria bacterium]|nr:cytochrome c biogenesis protein CcdA [Candidatus Peregrinibacteria bacterium]